MYFYKNNKEIEKIELNTNKKIDEFLKIIKKNKKLSKNIITFGLVGPCARNQAFYINNKVKSDFDFYLVSNKFNICLEKKIKNIFYDIFKDENNYSLHYISPSIFKKPDLMFFEYTNSGKVLYGKKLKKTDINKISRLEVLRNIIFRETHFLKLFKLKNNKLILNENVKKEEILYGYSKIIFSIGEVCLILDKTYSADNIKRNNLIKNNKYAQKISGFIKEHEKMQEFRYKNKIELDKNYLNKSFIFLDKIYNIIFNELKIKNIRKIKTSGLRYIWNQLFFTLNYYKQTKKIKILFIEPFIKVTLLNYELIKKINNNEEIDKKLYNEILIYWKIAPWFYYKI